MSIRQYLFLLIILITQIGCVIPRYVILDGRKVNCNKISKNWWGDAGQQPTSKEARELCACHPWVLEMRD